MPILRRGILLAVIVLLCDGIAAAQGRLPAPNPASPTLQTYPPPAPEPYPATVPSPPQTQPAPRPYQASDESSPPPSAQSTAKTGFLALPYLGGESHAGSTGDNFGVGFVLGALLGGRINPQFSLNGEIVIDVLNTKDLPSGVSETAVEVDLALSPLFHVPFPQGEFVIGPKLGFFGGSAQVTENGNDLVKGTVSGYLAGINTGVFFAVNQSVSLGGFFNFTLRKPTKVCATLSGGDQVCNSTTDFTSEKVLAVAAGALF